jgi:cell wall-associated NlpC family hydrolase
MGCSTVPTELPRPESAPVGERRAEALMQALLSLGLDYRYGGNSPEAGFDCSGLVAHVFQEAYGIRLPHNARAQSQFGSEVSLSELRAGDLVFYNTQNQPFSHVGIYLGDGRFVHAPKTGAQVRVESIRAAYWSQRFNGARRIEPPL